MITRTLRQLVLAAALPLTLAACSSGTKPGDTDVELGSTKKTGSEHPAMSDGDSLASGMQRDTARRPTGKQIYNQSGRAVDRNHDGIAD